MIEGSRQASRIHGHQTVKIRWFCAFALLVVLLLALQNLGRFVSATASPPRKSDLIVILGGGLGERAIRGADLYQDGFAQNILLTGMDRISHGPPSDNPYFRFRYLLWRGVPQDAMIIDDSPSSTWKEAEYIARLCLSRGWTRLLIVSDPPHFRRLAWVYRRVLDRAGIEWRLIDATSPWWVADYWWQNARSAQFAFMEAIKLCYYMFIHGNVMPIGQPEI